MWHTMTSWHTLGVATVFRWYWAWGLMFQNVITTIAHHWQNNWQYIAFLEMSSYFTWTKVRLLTILWQYLHEHYGCEGKFEFILDWNTLYKWLKKYLWTWFYYVNSHIDIIYFPKKFGAILLRLHINKWYDTKTTKIWN